MNVVSKSKGSKYLEHNINKELKTHWSSKIFYYPSKKKDFILLKRSRGGILLAYFPLFFGLSNI